LLPWAGREWGAVKENEKKRKDWKRKNEKNRLFNFLEIVIDNLYLLYYY
jgi:hypothetical protein